MSFVLWSLVALLNLATFAVFGWDKRQSRTAGARRVPERTLLWLMFAGGFPGAWIAMRIFRHKTVKRPFRTWAAAASVFSPLWLLVWYTLR